MLGGDETTDDPVVADTRNFYKVELWTRHEGWAVTQLSARSVCPR
jgi:hypothetical protein